MSVPTLKDKLSKLIDAFILPKYENAVSYEISLVITKTRYYYSVIYLISKVDIKDKSFWTITEDTEHLFDMLGRTDSDIITIYFKDDKNGDRVYFG